jgi:peptidoglycan/xylan/chitin deacetylase (PgdA/CDA1 family)
MQSHSGLTTSGPGLRRSQWSKRRPLDFASRMFDRVGVLDAAIRVAAGRYIMAYHRVLSASEALAQWCHPAIWIRPETLDAHLSFFARIGTIVPLQELLTAPDRGGPLFSVTFDDAWIDSFERALPVLAAHGAPACFFVPTDAVSSGRLFWTEEVAQKLGAVLLGPRAMPLLEHLGWNCDLLGNAPALLQRLMDYIERLKELPLTDRQRTIDDLYGRLGVSAAPVSGCIMNWDQIRTLASLGHSIGSHSRSHLILRDIELARVDEELVESKQILEQQLGRAVDYFCFPNARYDALSRERVLAAGYRYGFRMHNLEVRHNEHRALVPRFSASEANSDLSLLKARFLRAHFQ